MGVGPPHTIEEVTEGDEVMEKRGRQDGITTEQAKGRTQRWQPLLPNLQRGRTKHRGAHRTWRAHALRSALGHFIGVLCTAFLSPTRTTSHPATRPALRVRTTHLPQGCPAPLIIARRVQSRPERQIDRMIQRLFTRASRYPISPHKVSNGMPNTIGPPGTVITIEEPITSEAVITPTVTRLIVRSTRSPKLSRRLRSSSTRMRPCRASLTSRARSRGTDVTIPKKSVSVACPRRRASTGW